MNEENQTLENSNENFDDTPIENRKKDIENSSTNKEYSKWIDNRGDNVKKVFGFNRSAELVNGRAAMIGFFMLILTELVFRGKPVTSSIFGIN